MCFAIIYLSSRTYFFISRRYNSLNGLFRSFSSQFKLRLCALVRVFVCVQRESVCVRACVRTRVRVCVRVWGRGGGGGNVCACRRDRNRASYVMDYYNRLCTVVMFRYIGL